jgi:hypothetical protein
MDEEANRRLDEEKQILEEQQNIGDDIGGHMNRSY